MPLVVRDRDPRTPDSSMLKYMQVGPGYQGGPRAVHFGQGIWVALREAHLIGKKTQRFYQHFSFSWPGAVWGMATTLVYGYLIVVPDPAMVDVFGRTTVAFLANVGLFVTLCGNFSIYGSRWFLESQALARAVDQCKDTLDIDPNAGSTFNANKWDFDTPLRRCRFLLKLLTHMTLACLTLLGVLWLCPNVGKVVYTAAFLTGGYFFLYVQGYTYVVDLILVLSVHSVMHVVMLLESDPLSLGSGYRGSRATGGKFRFWREVVEKHKAMSAMFESIWEPAVWVVGPHIAVICLFALIGLAGILQGAKDQGWFAAAAGLSTLLAAIVAMKRLLERMSFVTEMCMSGSLLQRSILSLVISRCGECPWGPDQLAAAGYADAAEERLDHDRCLSYVALNKTGARMFGVLLDSSLVARFSVAGVLGFAALLFHVAGSLDLGEHLLPQVNVKSVVQRVREHINVMELPST